MVNFPVCVEKDGDQLKIVWNVPADVLTNITIRAKKNTSSTTKFKGGMVMYREKVN